jgi:hypothetical protein
MSTEIMDPIQVVEKANAVLNNVNLPDRHSYFQIEKFIIGKEGTLQGKLWQIVKEIDVRMETFDTYQKQLEDAEDNLELMDIKIEKLEIQIREKGGDDFGLERNEEIKQLNIREHEINIRKAQRDKALLVRSSRKVRHKLKCVIEEIAYLTMAYQKISEKESIKPWDDAEVQQEIWNDKLLEEYNLRAILNRPLDTEFVKTVLCLHDDAKVKQHMVKTIDNIQRKLEESVNKLNSSE